MQNKLASFGNSEKEMFTFALLCVEMNMNMPRFLFYLLEIC